MQDLSKSSCEKIKISELFVLEEPTIDAPVLIAEKGRYDVFSGKGYEGKSYGDKFNERVLGYENLFFDSSFVVSKTTFWVEFMKKPFILIGETIRLIPILLTLELNNDLISELKKAIYYALSELPKDRTLSIDILQQVEISISQDVFLMD